MNKGYVLAALAGIAWGTIPLSVKHIYAIGSASAVQISFFRFLIAFLVLVPIARGKKVAPILWNRWSVLMGFWGVFWMSSVSFYGINYTSAVNATILFNANPLFVAAFVIFFKWESLNPLTVAGVVLGISGVIFVSGVETSVHLWGDVLVLVGAFGWAVYTVLSHKLRTFSSVSVTTSSLFWGLLCFCTVIWRDVSPVTRSTWLWISYIGIVPTAAAFFCYVKAVDLTGSTKASVFQYLAPAVAVLVSFFLGLEKIDLLQIAGIVLIVAGIELSRK